MSPINGTPQPNRKIGGKGKGGKGGKHADSWSCLVVAIALLAGPWLLNLVLTASQAAG